MRINTLTTIFLSLIFLVSCVPEVSFEGNPVNQYGGVGRTNSYEEWGKFYRSTYFIDEFRSCPDKSGAIASPFLLTSKKMLVPNASGSVVCLENRTFKWIIALDSGDVVASAMCADPSQNSYLIGLSGIIYSISPDGKIRWKKKLVDTLTKYSLFSDLLAQKDGIIAASNDGTIAKFDFNGNVIWKKKYALSPLKTFSAMESGKIILSLSHNEFGASDTIVCLSTDGKELWKTGFPYMRLIRNSSVYKNRIVQPATERRGVNNLNLALVLDTNGVIINRIETAISPRFVSISRDEDIYLAGFNSGVASEHSGVLCYDKSFNLKWQIFIPVAVSSPIMIGKDRIAFFGQQEHSSGVYFLRKDGIYESMTSLSDAPITVLPPVYNPDGSILFASAQKLEIIRIDDSDFNKFIPW